MKHFYFVCCFILAACTTPAPSPTPHSTLTPTPSIAPSATPTIAVTSTETPYPTATPPLWPEFNSQMLLPAPLYYIRGNDFERGSSCPFAHVMCLGPVGGSLTEVGPCFIWGGIHGFDVSPVDGSIVMAAQGALWLLDADGRNPTELIEGLPNPEVAEDTADIQDPEWSPDGAKIAYADGGMRIVDVASGERIDIIDNECFFDEELGTSYSPCFYGVWYVEPRWSPDGSALLFRSQSSDSFFQELYSLSSQEPPFGIPGTTVVRSDDIAWGHDSTTLLFDYRGPVGPGSLDLADRALVRFDWATGQAKALWSHSDPADPAFASTGSNPWQVRYPLEMSDGRILFFQAEPCDSESCYKYALAEATPTPDGFTLDILRHNALPSGAREVVWHESGEYIAFVIGGYGGPWYVTVMRVSTGEMFVTTEEKQPPSHLIWGARSPGS